MFIHIECRTPIHLAASSSENDPESEPFGLIEQDDWHLFDSNNDSPITRSQSPPALDPRVDGPAQLHVHAELEEEQGAGSRSESQMHSDHRQPDEVWREYHPLLTGK
jgi:hypothetical protein